MQQTRATTAWTHVWDQTSIIGSTGMVAGGKLYWVGQGLLELGLTTGTKFWHNTLLTLNEEMSEEKELCATIHVDKSLVVVTADSSNLYPIIGLWR